MIMVLTCLISFDIVTLSIVVFEKLEPRKFITAWYPHVCVCVCNGMVFWLKAFYDIVIVVIVDDGGQQMILNRIVVPSKSDSRPPNLVLPTRSMQFSSLAWRCKSSNRNIYHDDFHESLSKSSHGGITGISWTFSCLFFRIGVSRGNRSSYACASVKC